LQTSKPGLRFEPCRRQVELKFSDLAGALTQTTLEQGRFFFFSEKNHEQTSIPLNFELQITDLRLDLNKKVSSVLCLTDSDGHSF
jgi:hypothetical protein